MMDTLDGTIRRIASTHLLVGFVLAGLVVGMVAALANPVELTQMMEIPSLTIGALHGWHIDLISPWIPIPPW